MDNRIHGDDEIHPVYTPGVARPSNVREGAKEGRPVYGASRRRTERFVDEQSAAAEVNRLRMVAAGLEDEVAALRRRLQDSPKRVRTLEERLLESKANSPKRSPKTRSSPTHCARRANTSPPCEMKSTSSPSHHRGTAPCSA